MLEPALYDALSHRNLHEFLSSWGIRIIAGALLVLNVAHAGSVKP